MSKKFPHWLDESAPHVWLPYAQMQTAPTPLPVKSTKGAKIILEDGRELVDGIASWWSACHGYQHPHIVKAMQNQAEKLPHVMFAGLANEPAYTLAARLAKLTNLPRVFFSDSGSVAVEVAMKIAVHYWRNQGVKNKTRFLSFQHSYHGDTMGAMSISDPDRMHQVYAGYMPMQYVVPLPRDEYALAEFESLLKAESKHIAGVFLEPLLQGAGGMRFHGPDMVAEIHRLCKAHHTLFIADEIATGFGRTGMMFACQEAGITPDVMCIGKALTGGAMSLAATLASEEIFAAFLGDSLEKALMHGPTYMGNALACAAANASLDLFEKEPRLDQVAALETLMHKEMQRFHELPNIADVRVKGAIGVVEFKEIDWNTIFAMREFFIEQGAWLRPFGNVLYLMPSFTISEPEIKLLIDVMEKAVKKFTK